VARPYAAESLSERHHGEVPDATFPPRPSEVYHLSTKSCKMFRLCLFAIAAMALCFAADLEKEITGKITCTSAQTIEPSWKVHIQLHDKTVTDATLAIIASTVITDAKTFPIMYKLKYNPALIKPDHTYALFVHIDGSDNQHLFLNNIHTPVVFTDGKVPVIDIILTPVQEQQDKACSPVQCPAGKPKQCAYGYEKKDGCKICKCHDPCKLQKCEPKEKCVVEKKVDGKFWARCETAPIKRAQEEKLTKAACMEPKQVGDLRKLERRWFWSWVTESCEQFTYGGRTGNSNNFKTKLECEKLCKV